MARGVVLLTDLHPTFEKRVNDQDLDGLLALYEPDAMMVQADGVAETGTAAIRQQLAGILALGGRITLRTRYALEAGDLALLSCEWTLAAEGEEMSAVTHEVARRQPDGGWLYVIDHPFAGLQAELPVGGARGQARGSDDQEGAG